MLKIATWNMAYWSHKSELKEAWDYISNEIDADIFLIQESHPLEEIKNVIWHQIGGKRNWGSGIYSKRYSLSEIEIPESCKGICTAALANVGSSKPLALISIYGLFEKIQGRSYVTPNNHRSLSDLTSILCGSGRSKCNVVMGGDLNESLQFDVKFGGKESEIFFQRIENFNLVDCFKPFYTDYVQTLRHRGSETPWQNDYLFVDKRISNKLQDCQVIDNEKVRKFSDHNPVIITLDI